MLRNLKENAACVTTAYVLTFCAENEVILTESHPSSSALPAVEPRSSYFASKTHYESLARRILAVIRAGGRFVLITGDPPADPQFLSQALGNLGGSGYAIIDIRCGPELRGKELEGAAPILGVAGTAPGSSSLFLFIDFDQLSDRQIEEICETAMDEERHVASAVLLASLDFVLRLQQPALRCLKDRVTAHFCVQEVSDDEVFPFLHDQLLAQRDRRSEARGFRRGIVIGLVACAAVTAAAAGAFVFLYPITDRVCEAPASTEESRSVGEQALMLRPIEGVATSAVSTQVTPKPETKGMPDPGLPPLSAATTLPPAEADGSRPIDAPAPAYPTPAARLSEAEIGALMGRGDAFLRAGDITSARLYYERAVDAGDGNAALQLGASFDPVVVGLAGLRGITGDPAQALSWYRRARELGVSEAEGRIKSLEARALGQANSLSR
jgi:hypothetical protein